MWYVCVFYCSNASFPATGIILVVNFCVFYYFTVLFPATKLAVFLRVFYCFTVSFPTTVLAVVFVCVLLLHCFVSSQYTICGLGECFLFHSFVSTTILAAVFEFV